MLKNLVKGLYEEITDDEVMLAENNLIGFFRKLEAIDERLLQADVVNSSDLNNEVCNEDFRS